MGEKVGLVGKEDGRVARGSWAEGGRKWIKILDEKLVDRFALRIDGHRPQHPTDTHNFVVLSNKILILVKRFIS